ncbi:hypothetical protein ACJX0J_016053, partial [Zea mays]
YVSTLWNDRFEQFEWFYSWKDCLTHFKNCCFILMLMGLFCDVAYNFIIVFMILLLIKLEYPIFEWMYIDVLYEKLLSRPTRQQVCGAKTTVVPTVYALGKKTSPINGHISMVQIDATHNLSLSHCHTAATLPGNMQDN